MAHFIEKFSSVLAGPACPVAVDDIRKRVRYPMMGNYDTYVDFAMRSYTFIHPGGVMMGARIKGKPVNLQVRLWQDYPESHHVN